MWHTSVEPRFVRLIRVRNQPSHQIDEEVGDPAVAGVLDLRDIFELIVDGKRRRKRGHVLEATRGSVV